MTRDLEEATRQHWGLVKQQGGEVFDATLAAMRGREDWEVATKLITTGDEQGTVRNLLTDALGCRRARTTLP